MQQHSAVKSLTRVRMHQLALLRFMLCAANILYCVFLK